MEATGLFVKTCTQSELKKKIAELGEKYKGAVNTVDPGGSTPLLLACEQNLVVDVAALLACGADPTVEGFRSIKRLPDLKYRCTALMLAARDNRVEIVRILLDHERVDVNQSSSDTGATALWFACHNDHVAVVTLLLAYPHIDVNQGRTDTGVTPLFIACQGGLHAIVTLLLAHGGIDVNQATSDTGESPRYISRHGMTPLYISCWERQPTIVSLLLAHDGIDVNRATTDTGETPLFIAAWRGFTEIVTMLLAAEEINVNHASKDAGATPLYIACSQRNTGIMRILLADGRADINIPLSDDLGSLTALHATAVSGQLFATQLLVAYGANMTAVDIDEETAAEVATAEGYPWVAEWLTAVVGWSQLRVAAGCRLYEDAALLLRQGRVDTDDTAVTSVQDLLLLLATSQTEPAALPWQNAPPICKATIKLVADATRGWHRTTHWLHHKAVRDAVVVVLVVVARLQVKSALSAESSHTSPAVDDLLPLLPIELWLCAMRFYMRSWWGVSKGT